jgi:hypothetical protein
VLSKRLKIISACLIAFSALLVAFFIWPKIASAQVIFNEIAWMGTTNNTADEWMELYNNSDTVIDLTGWKIIWGADNKYSADLSGQISANSYFLLERTDDNSVPGIIADQTYAGALSNGGDYLKLFNAQNNLIDEINASDGWPAGDNVQKLTMEKTNGGAWQNSQSPGGTPKAQNSAPASTTNPPTPSPASTSPDSPTAGSWSSPAPTQTIQYSQGVLINEFLPYPEKDAKEWVEIVNNGSSAVNLTGWQIDDDNNSTLPQVIPENTTIVPGDFLVISFNKATLNNDGDKVRLLWPDDQVVNTVSFTRATQGQSCARFDAGWFWTNQPTPGQANKKSFYGADETVNTGSSGTSKISTIEEKVAAPSSAPTPQKQNNQNTATTSNSPSPNNNLLTGVGIPNPNLTAAVGSSIKENLTLKTVMSLAAVLLLAGLTAVGLVYFRRLKQVDNENFDD